MTYNEFFETYKGKIIDYDKACGVQCVDLAVMYLAKVYGITGVNGNARDYFEKFDSKKPLKENFDKISNTPEFIPQKGDICVWGSGLGQYGHIAIATGEGTTSIFKTWDSNWGSKQIKQVTHSYKGFLGVLRYTGKKTTTTTKKKTTTEIAKEVIQGLWGNGEDRKTKLTNAGYNYKTIQNAVNKLLK